MILTTLALLVVLVGLLYLYLTWNFDHWKKRGVAGPKPWPLMGNYPGVFTQKRNMADDIDDHYKAFKRTNDFIGVFNCRTPQLMVLSPELAHRVYVNDFKSFHDNEASLFIDENSDFILSNNPFTLTGDEWKERRAEITPGLTISRVKTVFPVTAKICKVMSDYIKDKIRVPPKDGLDAKDISLRFTSQVVTDCVLGLNAESFTPNPTPIFDMAKKIFEKSFVFFFYIMLMGVFPFISKIYKFRFIPKSIEDFFVNLMEKAITVRRSQKDQTVRLDFMNYILQLQEKKNLTTLEVTSHTMTFLLDGFETTATVLSHCLLCLARYPDAQEKLRSEIFENLGKSGDIDFDKMIELPYLDASVHEAVRVIPPALFSTKLCTEDIQLTNKDGRTVKVSKGNVVVVPLYSLMLDEDYYPNPHEYQPERFLEENGGVKKYREMGVYNGFGDGPRVCIGMRFALVQIKAAIVSILRNFDLHINPKTRKDNKIDPTYFIGRLDGGVWIDFVERR